MPPLCRHLLVFGALSRSRDRTRRPDESRTIDNASLTAARFHSWTMRNIGVALMRLDNGCVLHPFLVTMDDPNLNRRAASFLVAGRKN